MWILKGKVRSRPRNVRKKVLRGWSQLLTQGLGYMNNLLIYWLQNVWKHLCPEIKMLKTDFHNIFIKWNFGLFWALFGIESITPWQLLALLSSKMVLFHFSLFVCFFFTALLIKTRSQQYGNSASVSKWWKTVPLSNNISRWESASATDSQKTTGSEWCLGSMGATTAGSFVITEKQRGYS